MLLQAASDLSIDLNHSYLVGDKISDLEAGARAGCRTILVRTGYGSTLPESFDQTGLNLWRITADLQEAVKFLSQ